MPETINLEGTKHAIVDVPVEDLILRRWSPRAFANKPVSDGDFKTIFTAASWAASSNNEQPWRFLVGRKGDETWKKIFGSLVPKNQIWAESAPVLYASLAKKTFTYNSSPNRVAMHDVGAATATLSLQATALGLHTHGMAGFVQDLLRAYFGIPSDFEAVAVWALGYLGDPDRLPDDFKRLELLGRMRKPLYEFVFSEWGQAATF